MQLMFDIRQRASWSSRNSLGDLMAFAGSVHCLSLPYILQFECTVRHDIHAGSSVGDPGHRRPVTNSRQSAFLGGFRAGVDARI
jgi:hypothetical protein